MKKLLAIFTIFSFLSVSVYAGEFADLRKKIAETRDSAITMLKNKDKRGADYQKTAKDTAEATDNMIQKMKAPAGKEAKFKDLKDTWAAFKKTREQEVIPLTLQGKDEEARKIAESIQKERMKKLNALCDELEK
jgi:23S rRNA pseudoU1915 N3-methylase RlmH